jgi:PAS domain S-box-containing protein
MAIRSKRFIGLHILALITAAWTVFVITLAVYQFSHIRDDVTEMAANEARVHFNRDQAFRLWGASHGGVYVPVDEQTPANEYLAHIKERDIETPAGKRLTLMNPAYMIRQMSKMYSDLYEVVGHITSLRPLRPENAPDEWERKALESFEKGEIEVIELADINGEPYMRLMKPMIAKKTCLKCHGHQGYKEGEIRGGVSVSVPMATYLARERRQFSSYLLFCGLIWILGFSIICIGVSWVNKGVKEQEKLEETLRLEEDRTESLLKLFQLSGVSEKELTAFALEEGVRLTESEVGYLHFYNDDQKSLQLFLWSKEVLKKCTAETTLKYPLDDAGIWADAIRLRRPVTHNDYQNLPDKKGYPKGHFHVVRHMSVPIFYDNRIVAVAGVGNKNKDYTKSDTRQLTLYMNSMWVILRQMRMEEERKKDYLNLVGVIVVALNSDKTVSFINTTGCEILGYKREEIIGKDWFDNFLPERFREEIKLVFNKLMAGETTLVEHYENPILNKDGEERVIRWNNRLVRDHKGDIIGTLGTGEDITDKKMAEKAL